MIHMWFRCRKFPLIYSGLANQVIDFHGNIVFFAIQIFSHAYDVLIIDSITVQLNSSRLRKDHVS